MGGKGEETQSVVTSQWCNNYRILQLEETFRDHLFQLPMHFRANQKLSCWASSASLLQFHLPLAYHCYWYPSDLSWPIITNGTTLEHWHKETGWAAAYCESVTTGFTRAETLPALSQDDFISYRLFVLLISFWEWRSSGFQNSLQLASVQMLVTKSAGFVPSLLGDACFCCSFFLLGKWKGIFHRWRKITLISRCLSDLAVSEVLKTVAFLWVAALSLVRSQVVCVCDTPTPVKIL